MPTPNLPAHLANRQQRQLVDNAFAGMAGSLPAHISIRANRFTLVGADGARQTLDTTYLHVCFIDVSEAIGKLYYAYEYQDGSDDPPTCWSANGVTPSREAAERQARTCAECQWNVRGSDTSKLSGKAIKACRDEKWTAVTLASVDIAAQGQVTGMRPLYPDVLWQLRITPGSFKNWRGFVERCKSQQADMSLLVTRVAFEPDKNGVLTFQPVSWIDATIADIRDKAWASNVTDALVGRGEALPALEAPACALQAPAAEREHEATVAANAAANVLATTSDVAAPERRRRRTKAEMEAARTGKTTQNQQPNLGVQAPSLLPASTGQAPFREAAQSQPPNFGIQAPSPLPPGADAALDDFFGPRK